MFATPDTLSKYKQIVFEGAQGLLLDQDHGFSPHVTRSSTGLPNVLSICEENAIERLDVIYVTRCYLTRHGAGFMNNEHHPMPFVNVVDPTNVPHAYQGTIRYAPLDIDQLHKSIQRDLHNGTSHAYGPKVKLNPGLAITCLDQLVSAPDVVHKGSMQKLGTATDIGKQISDMIGFYTPPIKSYGPTRSTIQGYETLACNKAA
jgi:adenylosuccinate synthase